MKSNFWEEYEASPRGIVSPRILIPLAVAGIIIILISGFIENYIRNRDYLTLMDNQAKLFITALANTGQSSLEVADALETEIHDRMLTNLHLISALHEITPFTKKSLKERRKQGHYDRLDIYDSRGKLIVSESDSATASAEVPRDILAAVNNGLLEDIMLTSGDFPGTASDIFTALVHRRSGGVVVGIVSNKNIQSFRKLYGFGRLFKEFERTPEVEYVALENAETIIAGIFGSYKLSKFSEDSFLQDAILHNDVSTRIVYYDDVPIYEAVVSFNGSQGSIGLLRLGLSMQNYVLMERKVKRSMVIFGILLLVMGVTLMSFYLSNRNRQILRKGFIRLQKSTNLILENMGSGVIAVENNGTIQLANKQAAVLLNKNKNDIMGYPVDVLPEEVSRLYKKSITEKKEILHPYLFWYKNNGIARQISLRTTFLMKDSNIENCILILDDTTEQARLEEQLRRQEKLTAMGKLASRVAHEIRNPLNSMGLIVQSLVRKFSHSEELDKYSKNLNIVEKEIYRINDIVGEFIKFARPAKIHKEPIDFNLFFSEIETLFQSKFEDNQIKFELYVNQNKSITGDKDQLKQVFINLVENSVQAITSPGNININVEFYTECCEIRVKDSGEGISKENLLNIFDLYFTTKRSGTGVGLAVVHQIISGHGGSVEIKSEPSKGAVFIIRLPYHEEEECV